MCYYIGCYKFSKKNIKIFQKKFEKKFEKNFKKNFKNKLRKLKSNNLIKICIIICSTSSIHTSSNAHFEK